MRTWSVFFHKFFVRTGELMAYLSCEPAFAIIEQPSADVSTFKFMEN